MLQFIILFLWFMCAVLVWNGIAPYVGELTAGRQCLILLVLIIGAPFMLVAQAFEIILDCFLEEGWNDDD